MSVLTTFPMSMAISLTVSNLKEKGFTRSHGLSLSGQGMSWQQLSPSKAM